MSTFLRYLLSLALHFAWQRAGKGGPVPPVRFPGRGKQPVALPMIGPWQMMAVMWIAKRIWGRYGSQIRNHLANNANDLARQAARYIPDPKVAGAAAGTTSPPANVSAPTPAPSSASSAAPRPAPNFHTQPLSGSAPQNGTQNSAQDTSTANTPQGTLPQGSILGKLRGRS